MVHFSSLLQTGPLLGMHLHQQTSLQILNQKVKRTVHSPRLLLPWQEVSYLFPEVLQEVLLSEVLHQLQYICPDYAENPQLPAKILLLLPVLQHL